MFAPRRLRLPGLVGVVLALALTGCGEEAGPIDDGSYSSLQAGAPDILDELGITLVSLEQPAAAAPTEVRSALADEGLDAATSTVGPVEGLALDPEQVAGLIGLTGNLGQRATEGDGRYVVLSFDTLESAVVFAQSDPTVFDEADLEEVRTAYFSGNLVAYYAPRSKGDAPDRFRSALDALAGT